MKPELYDVVIVGAGPAGCTCAYQLANKGLKIALIEKDEFPRDKICGDALSPDVINQLRRMNPELLEEFLEQVEKVPAHGIRFVAPNHKFLDIKFSDPDQNRTAGFIATRVVFDAFMYNQVKDKAGIDTFQKHEVSDVSHTEDGVFVKTDKSLFRGKMVVGADGAHSRVKKHLSQNKVEKNHHCAGLRQYYENVSGFKESHIELHFYKDLLPGYFWVFPMANNRANVGLGMLSNEIGKHNINLREKLADIIEHHPLIKERFKDAKPMETVKGFGLPLGSKKRSCSGDRYLLLGDAASLIDPFSGEGIGNAIRSGRIAADHIQSAFKEQRFDAKFNMRYDKELYGKMWNELRLSRILQNTLKYPAISNFFVNKARKNQSIQLLMTSMLDNNIDIKKELLKPSFFYKLIFQ